MHTGVWLLLFVFVSVPVSYLIVVLCHLFFKNSNMLSVNY